MGQKKCGPQRSIANIALSGKNAGNQDIVVTCAVCWLGAKESQERINHDQTLFADINTILGEIRLKYEGKQPVRHLVETMGAEAVEKYDQKITCCGGALAFSIPVVYYSQRMAVADGANAKEAGLDGNIVRATRLEEIAAKK